MTMSTAIRPPPSPVSEPKPMILPGRSVSGQTLVRPFVFMSVRRAVRGDGDRLGLGQPRATGPDHRLEAHPDLAQALLCLGGGSAG